MNQSKRLEKIPVKLRKKVVTKLEDISSKIKNAREKQGLSQEDLAEKLNVSPMTIQFIEQGRRFPSIQLLICICQFLSIEIKFEIT